MRKSPPKRFVVEKLLVAPCLSIWECDGIWIPGYPSLDRTTRALHGKPFDPWRPSYCSLRLVANWPRRLSTCSSALKSRCDWDVGLMLSWQHMATKTSAKIIKNGPADSQVHLFTEINGLDERCDTYHILQNITCIRAGGFGMLTPQFMQRLTCETWLPNLKPEISHS